MRRQMVVGGWSQRPAPVGKIDAQGAEVHRFVLPLKPWTCEEQRPDGPLLAVVGLNTGVLYLRADGTPGPFGERMVYTALTGEFEVLRFDAMKSRVQSAIVLSGRCELGAATVTVAAIDRQDQQFTLTPAEGASLPSESLAYATLSQGESSCSGRLDAKRVGGCGRARWARASAPAYQLGRALPAPCLRIKP